VSDEIEVVPVDDPSKVDAKADEAINRALDELVDARVEPAKFWDEFAERCDRADAFAAGILLDAAIERDLELERARRIAESMFAP
jgi:hypothetical protein